MRRVYHEGLPLAEVQGIDDEGIAHLAALLADPAESPVHANAALAIGMSQHVDAYAALAGFAAVQAAGGKLDRHGLRAHLAVRHGMGHLARSDPRALDWLKARLSADGPAEPRSFRGLSADRLARLERRSTASALALSGRPEAAQALLEEVAGVARSRRSKGSDDDPQQWRSHLEESLRLLEDVAARGPEAALDAGSPREASR